MRFQITYAARFDYAGPVTESHNELRAVPTTTASQRVTHNEVRTTPGSRVFSFVDYWGTQVDTFGVRAPHDTMEVVAECVVETQPTVRLIGSPRIGDMDVAFLDEHREFLQPSPHADWGDEIAALAADARKDAGDDLIGLLLTLHRTIGVRCEYTPGATWVGVDVDEVHRTRKGVAQDFAHLLVAMARAAGVPARYVSGYLFASDPTAESSVEDDRLQVKSHAWTEVAVPGFGWWGLDPTTRQQTGDHHVKVGHGRDYDDVAPLRGIYIGPPDGTVDVDVHMRRIPLTESQMRQAQQ